MQGGSIRDKVLVEANGLVNYSILQGQLAFSNSLLLCQNQRGAR